MAELLRTNVHNDVLWHPHGVMMMMKHGEGRGQGLCGGLRADLLLGRVVIIALFGRGFLHNNE